MDTPSTDSSTPLPRNQVQRSPNSRRMAITVMMGLVAMMSEARLAGIRSMAARKK